MLKVISLGNTLRGDDSVGPVVVDQLRNIDLPIPLTLIDAGSDAFTILEHLIEEDPVLIIDCAKMGKEPGQVKKINIDETAIQTIDKSISLHSFGFGEVYQMAKEIGDVAECKLIGVEPKSIEFGQELSDEVKASIPSIVNMVIEEANKYVR